MSTPLRRPRKPNLQESIREELPEIVNPRIIQSSMKSPIQPPRKRGRPRLYPINVSSEAKLNKDNDIEVIKEAKNESSNISLSEGHKEIKLNNTIGEKLKVFINEKPLLDDKIDKIVEKLDEIPEEYISSPSKKLKTDSCHTAEKLNLTKEELQKENDKIKRSLRYYRHNKHHQLLRNIIRDSREPINNKDAIFILDLIRCYTR